jgi:hypothetical protein
MIRSVASLKSVEEIIDLEKGSWFVIPARLACLLVGQPFQAVVLTGWKAGPTIESRKPGPFARQIQHPHPTLSRKGAGEGQILARVTNTERDLPNHLHWALQTQDTSGGSQRANTRRWLRFAAGGIEGRL